MSGICPMGEADCPIDRVRILDKSEDDEMPIT